MNIFTRFVVVSIIFLIMVSSRICFAGNSIDPSMIMDQIQKRNASAVVSELYNDLDTWNSVLRGIASGDEYWLKAAISLKKGADAGAGEMLTLAVGEALENNPKNVILIASKTFDLDSICGGPDVDDKRYDSYERAINAINLRIQKVTAAKEVDQENIYLRCIEYLKESKDNIARFYGIKKN